MLRVLGRDTLFANHFIINSPHNPYARMAQAANLDLQLAADSSSGASTDPQFQEEAKDPWKDFPWKHFPEYTVIERERHPFRPLLQKKKIVVRVIEQFQITLNLSSFHLLDIWRRI